MTALLWNILGLLAITSGSTLAFPGEYIPKSYYVIDQEGHKSDVVYFRSKRDVEMFPLLRLKRGGSSSQASSQASASASSHATASASSSASANAGAGSGGPNFFGGGGDYNPSFIPQGFPDNFGFGGQHPSSAYNGPILFSRFGEDTGSGVHVSGSAQGEKGAFSSSSSSVDGNGKIKYSVQSGKY